MEAEGQPMTALIDYIEREGMDGRLVMNALSDGCYAVSDNAVSPEDVGGKSAQWAVNWLKDNRGAYEL